MRQEPDIGAIYDFPTLVLGVLCDVYWQVTHVKPHASGKYVVLRRMGELLEVRRVGLTAFARMQRDGACALTQSTGSPAA